MVDIDLASFGLPWNAFVRDARHGDARAHGERPHDEGPACIGCRHVPKLRFVVDGPDGSGSADNRTPAADKAWVSIPASRWIGNPG
jgi:hypothetical protein